MLGAWLVVQKPCVCCCSMAAWDSLGLPCQHELSMCSGMWGKEQAMGHALAKGHHWWMAGVHSRVCATLLWHLGKFETHVTTVTGCILAQERAMVMGIEPVAFFLSVVFI